MKGKKLFLLSVITFLLTTILGLGACNQSSNPKSELGGLKYELSYDGTSYSVIGIGTCTDRDIVIPSTYNNLPVTSIAEKAFYECSSLTSVVIPDSVTSIGLYAFRGCSSLTSVTIPDSVTSIGSRAFHDCDSLQYHQYDNGYYLGNENNKYMALVKPINTSITNCTINKNTKIICNYAFGGCSSLTSVVIPDSLTSISSGAFYECDSLTNIIIPDSVTLIGEWAFSNCSSLTSVYYQGDIEKWCNISFSCSYSNPLCYAKNLYLNNELVTELIIPDTVTEIKASAFYNCDSLTSIEIGDSVTSIGERAFYDCKSLTSVVIGDSVTSIGTVAFNGCSSLTSIVIPASVTSIGYEVFDGCSGLTSIKVSEENTNYKDIDGNLYNKDGTILIQYAIGKKETSFTIPASVISIGNSAFDGCSKLTSVVIGDSVTSIGEKAFYECDGLTSIVIPASVTLIGDWAFWDCDSLTSVVIGDSVTSIGWCAFENCDSLTSVTFKNPNGWWRVNPSIATSWTSISSTDLADAATAANYLTSSYYYCYCYWKRN